MTETTLEKIGREIRDTVDEAVRYGDFSNVSYHISNVVNEAVDAWRGESRPSQGGSPSLYETRPGGTLLGVCLCGGGGLFGLFSLLCVAACVMTPYPDPMLAVGAIFFLFLTVVFGVVCFLGIRQLLRIRRYRTYIGVIGARTTVPVKELAEAVQKNVPKTEKELKRYANKRLFYQAHLDAADHVFFLTDAAYTEYTKAKKAYDLRRQQAESGKREMEALSEECRALIEEGRSYVAHIRRSNEKIPGEQMTKKLNHMERIVSRIFEVVKAHPEVAPDLSKLMNYYLPTTKKLLDTYAELDGQAVAGANISATKKEIEETVDTLNAAFERLLDGLYENKSWDVSADISVLHTMLAQDGLKK